MEKWDTDAVSRQFLFQAEDADRYLRQVQNKVKSNRAYECVYDEHLARFYVYNYLHGRTFLISRKALLDELRSLANTTLSAPHDAYDPQRFERYRQSYIAEIINQFTP
jgi:hypothetical protein